MKRYILLISIISSFFLITCNLDSSFDEYEGESFLDSSSLASGNWVLMPDMDFAADAAGTNADDYMDFSKVITTGPAGGLGGDVYRLEIKNLMTNGDFENGSTAPWFYYDVVNDHTDNPISDPWTHTGPAGTRVSTPFKTIQTGDESYMIDTDWDSSDNSGYLQLDNDERIILTLANMLGATYVANKTYRFNFDYRTSGRLLLSYIEEGYASAQTSDSQNYEAFGGPNGSDVDPNESILNFYPHLGENNSFTASSLSDYTSNALGFVESQGGYFDNFQIVRDVEGNFDLRLRLKMEIDHRPDLDLIHGYYKFSLWVKEEDLNNGNTNQFKADSIELTINSFDADGSLYDDNLVFYRTQELKDAYASTTGTFVDDWSSGWVHLEFASNELFQITENKDTTAMILTISPSNPGSTDKSWNRLSAGSILIADPTLEYSEYKW